MFPIQETNKIEVNRNIKKEKIDKDFNDVNFAKGKSLFFNVFNLV